MNIEEGKKEFLSMYKHLGYTANTKLSIQSLGSLKYKLMSPPNRTADALKEIIEALVLDSLIDKDLKLTAEGEKAIY